VTAAPRVLHDDLGARVEVVASPRRLVSLVPNLTETLWWWHLADRVVGRTAWCTAPPGAFGRSVTVRGTKNPDVGAIVALAPDLVVANEEENRELDVRRLRDAGVPVWVTRVRDLGEVVTSLGRLADALGVPRAADDLATGFARLEATRPDDPVPVCVPIWRGLPGADEGWMTVGTESVGADVLAAAGFAVWPPAPGERYPTVGHRDLLAAPVDAVLLPDEPYAFSRRDAADLPGHRVRLIDGTGLFWWGPRTPTAVADLRRLRRHLRRRRRRGDRLVA
jgi:ABC-type Fe3+-hydroxamate transport system substrate-binding protein